MPRQARSPAEVSRAARAKAARRYQPERVTLLLVGQAPPDGDRYFYYENVSTGDALFRYVVRGILRMEPDRANKARDLGELKRRGVFLIDLKPDPVAPR